MSEKSDIASLYRAHFDAMIAQDIEKLDKMLTDDYHLVHMSGVDQTKNEWLNHVASGEMRYFSTREESNVIQINGNSATLTGRNIVDARIYGFRNSWHLEQKMDLIKKNGKWYFTHSTATSY